MKNSSRFIVQTPANELNFFKATINFTEAMCEICSKLTMKTLEACVKNIQSHYCRGHYENICRYIMLHFYWLTST